MRCLFLTTAVVCALSALDVLSHTADAQLRPGELGWRTYVDERTGTRVDFPSALFPVDGGATERGIGRVFESEDGRAKFSAYTLANDEGDTPRSYLHRFLKVDPSTIDYRRVTDRFFAVSGVRNIAAVISTAPCIASTYPIPSANCAPGTAS